MRAKRLLPRVLLMVVSLVALVAGMGAGLARMGWPMDALSRDLMAMHGPLMIGGFLGTLISLERAVALADRYRWSLWVPAVNAAAALALLATGDSLLAKLLLTAGSAGLLLIFGCLLRIQTVRHMLVMTVGAGCWLLGNLLWLAGTPIFAVVHLWTAFLVLTIVGERMELSRVRRLTPAIENALLAALAVYVAGVLLTAGYGLGVSLAWGIRILGVGAILMAAWLLRYDIARRTIHGEGLPRYIAACLLVGYGWMAVGGAIGVWQGALYAGPMYAAMLHAILLGFVFSMIMGHAPIILPAVTGLRFSYHSYFYLPLILLHVSLFYRIYGYLTLDFTAQNWGGMLNAIAILTFLALTVWTMVTVNVATLKPVARPS
jgi:hypothetical protein